MREWVVLLSIVSIPAFAADWGRYTNTYIAPPPLAEIQAIRMPDFRHLPNYLPPGGKTHPNATPVVNHKFFQTPPPIGGK